MWRDSKLVLLLVIGSLTVMAGAVIAPILPDIIHQYHFNPGVAGSLVSLHFLTVALSVPLLGILADRIGSLSVLVPSLVLYALFGTAGAFIQSLGPLMATRGLLGVATGGITAASLGLLSKLYAKEARLQVIAYASGAISLANIVYPLLAGWIGSFKWQWVFFLYSIALPLAVAAILGLRTKPRIHRVQKSNHSQGDTIQPTNQSLLLFRNRQTLQILLTLGITSSIVYSFVIYIPLYMRTTLASETALIGMVLASKAVGATLISAFGVQQIVKQLSNIGAIAIGFGVMAFMLILLPQLHHVGLIFPTAILFGCGFGTVVPCLYSLLANQAPVHLQSSILAAGTGSNFLGQFLSPILLAPVFNLVGLTGVFYVAAIVALMAGLTTQISRTALAVSRHD